MLLFVHGL